MGTKLYNGVLMSLVLDVSKDISKCYLVNAGGSFDLYSLKDLCNGADELLANATSEDNYYLWYSKFYGEENG
jgi:hypothetical protein